MRSVALLALIALAGCPAPSPGPTSTDAGGCRPKTCATAGKDCGHLPDGCGGVLDCGQCQAPETCGGNGEPNLCSPCVPESEAAFCARGGKNCGSYTALDNCGALRGASCGSCAPPQTCGGGRIQNVCGTPDCTPEADATICARFGRNCGTVTLTDDCGRPRSVSCGDCPAPEVCGGAGVPNVCSCSPESDADFCARLGKNCGTPRADDNCGHPRSADCGACTAPETCGGSGQPNVCGDGECAETDEALCRRLGKDCGSITGNDSCGQPRTADCGTCSEPQTCGGAGVGNVCGLCIPETDAELCTAQARSCGVLTVSDCCGRPRTVDCGDCPTGQTCGGAGTPGVCGCLPETDQELCSAAGKDCGSITATDRCGTIHSLGCGTCSAPRTCGGDGRPNVCGCVPTTCAALNRTCGKVPDDCGGELDCGPCPGGAAPPPYCIRVAAANITSGNRQSYDPGDGIRIFQGLKPDVVMIQEFNYGGNTEADIRTMVQTTFGPSFWHFREAGAQIPNGVISRFPIVAAGEWRDSVAPNRDYAWAHIDAPGPRDLWVVSVHLLTTSAGNRAREANEIVNYVRQNVPAGDFLLIGGDFNTSNRSETCISTFSQIVSTNGPHPADQDGNGNTNRDRGHPLDWVLANSALRSYQGPVAIGRNRFPDGLVFDSRVYSPIGDVAPARSGDSAAVNMQHMAVVKEFCLPLQ